MNSRIRTLDDNGRALLSPTFLDFCIKVRKNDLSILPELGKSLSRFATYAIEKAWNSLMLSWKTPVSRT
jgi:hypothetical protein